MATNFGLKSSRKTVNARHVSVMAYQDLSIKCCKTITVKTLIIGELHLFTSNSAARSCPKNNFRISLPANSTQMKACMYITLKRIECVRWHGCEISLVFGKKKLPTLLVFVNKNYYNEEVLIST